MTKLGLIKILFVCFVLFFFGFKKVSASDFETKYHFQYTLTDLNYALPVQVYLKTSFKNKKSDFYLTSFSLKIPNYFKIENLMLIESEGFSAPEISNDKNYQNLRVILNQPKLGRGLEYGFLISYQQDKIVHHNGRIKEFLIPALDLKENEEATIDLLLPIDQKDNVSIAKPKPDLIKNIDDKRKLIRWHNPKVRTVLLVLGESQRYQVRLQYHLKNDKPVPAYADIAFPPDTLYQKVFIQQINPIADKFFSDLDGNYLGRYVLLPMETKTVTFSGQIEVYAQPRKDIIEEIRYFYSLQRDHLLSTENSYWRLDNYELLPELKTPQEIYNFVVQRINYDYGKIEKNLGRLGGSFALKYGLGVCTEYSDLFIAIAREKGLLAREIQGFGYSFDQYLRPLSLMTDLLHSWIEFFDDKKQIWVPVDPTWEDTSGIDYFSSLDFNHIVFVIHGKDADSPKPAGMYKVNNSRDIDVSLANNELKERLDYQILDIKTEKFYQTGKKNKIYIDVKNNSNVYLWRPKIDIKTPGWIRAEIENLKDLQPFVPYEHKRIIVWLIPEKKIFTRNAEIEFIFGDKKFVKHLSVNSYIINSNLIKNIFFALFFLVVFIVISYIYVDKRKKY